MIDEHEWRSILQVAEDGTFSLAAKHLFVSQPSLSQCIKKVENELAVQLFERNSNPLRLTEAGKIYVEEARNISRAKEQILQRIADLSEMRSGTIRIGSSYTRSAWLLTQVLPKFCTRFTGIDVSVTEASTRRLKEYLLDGEVDFALLYEPLEERSFDSIHIVDERVLLAVPTDSPLVKRFQGKQIVPYPKISFKRLQDEPFITLKKSRKMREVYDNLCQETAVTPKAVYEANSIILAASLCANGLGATLVTDTMLKGGSFKTDPFYFELKENVEPRRLVAAYNQQKGLSKAAEMFINMLREI